MASPWQTGAPSTPRSKTKPAASPASSRSPQVSTSGRSFFGSFTRSKDKESRRKSDCEDSIPMSREKVPGSFRSEHLRMSPRDPFALSGRNAEDSATSAGNCTSQRGYREKNSRSLRAIKRTESERERVPSTARKLPGASPRRSWSASSHRTPQRDPFAPESGDTGSRRKSSASRHSLSNAVRASPKDPFSLQRHSSEISCRSPEDELTSAPAQPMFEAPRDPFATVVESPTQQCVMEFPDLNPTVEFIAPTLLLDKTKQPGRAPSGSFPDLVSPGCIRRLGGTGITDRDSSAAAAESSPPASKDACHAMPSTPHWSEPGMKRLQSIGARLRLFGGGNSSNSSSNCTFQEVQASKAQEDEGEAGLGPNKNSSSRTSSNTSSSTNSSTTTNSTFRTITPLSAASSADRSLVSSANASYKEASRETREVSELGQDVPVLSGAPTIADRPAVDSCTVSRLPGRFPGVYHGLEECSVGSGSESSPFTFAESASASKWTNRKTPTVPDGNSRCTAPSPLSTDLSRCAVNSRGAVDLPRHQPLLFLERRMARVVGGNSAALDELGFASQAEAIERFGVFWSLFDICSSLKMEEWDEAASKVANREAEFITLKLRLRDLNTNALLNSAWVYLELHPGGNTPGTLSGTHLIGYLSPAPSVPTTSAAPALLSPLVKNTVRGSPQASPAPATPSPDTACRDDAPPPSPSVWRRFKGGIGALLPWQKKNLPGKNPSQGHALRDGAEATEVASSADVRMRSTNQSKPRRPRIRRLSLDTPSPQGMAPGSSGPRSSLDLPPTAEESFLGQNLGKSTAEGQRGSFLWFLPAVRRSVDLAFGSSGEGRSGGRGSNPRRRSMDVPFSAEVCFPSESSRSGSRQGRRSLDIYTNSAGPTEVSPASQEEDRLGGAAGKPYEVLRAKSPQLHAPRLLPEPPKMDGPSSASQCVMPVTAEGPATATAARPVLEKGAADVIKTRHSLDLPSRQIPADRLLPNVRFQDLRVDVTSAAAWGAGSLQSCRTADSARRSLDLPLNRDVSSQGKLQRDQRLWPAADVSNGRVTQESDVSRLGADQVEENKLSDPASQSPAFSRAAGPGRWGPGDQAELQGQGQLESGTGQSFSGRRWAAHGACVRQGGADGISREVRSSQETNASCVAPSDGVLTRLRGGRCEEGSRGVHGLQAGRSDCGAPRGQEQGAGWQSDWTPSASDADSDVLIDRRLSLDLPLGRRQEGAQVPGLQSADVTPRHVAHDAGSAPVAGWERELGARLGACSSVAHRRSVDLPARGPLDGLLPPVPRGESWGRQTAVVARSPGVNQSAGQRRSLDLPQSRSWSRPGTEKARQGDRYHAGRGTHGSSAFRTSPAGRPRDLPAEDMRQGPERDAFGSTQGDIWGGKGALRISRSVTGRRSLDLPSARERGFQGGSFTPKGPAVVHHWSDESIPDGMAVGASAHIATVTSATVDSATVNGVNSFSNSRLVSHLSSLRRVTSQHHMTSPHGPGMKSPPGAEVPRGMAKHPCHVPSSLPRASSMQNVPGCPADVYSIAQGNQLSLPSPPLAISPLAHRSAMLAPSPGFMRSPGGGILAAVGRASGSAALPAHRQPLVRCATGPTTRMHLPPPAVTPLARGVYGRPGGELSGGSSFGMPQAVRRVQSASVERHKSEHSEGREGESSLETSHSVPTHFRNVPGNSLLRTWDSEQYNGSGDVTCGLPKAGLAASPALVLPRYAPLSEHVPTRTGGVLLGSSAREAAETSQAVISKEALMRLLSLSSTDSGDIAPALSALALESGPGYTQNPNDTESILIISTPGRDLEAESEEASKEGAVPASHGLLRMKSAGAVLETQGIEGGELKREKETGKKVTWADNVGVPSRTEAKKKGAKGAAKGAGGTVYAGGAEGTQTQSVSKANPSKVQQAAVGGNPARRAGERLPSAVDHVFGRVMQGAGTGPEELSTDAPPSMYNKTTCALQQEPSGELPLRAQAGRGLQPPSTQAHLCGVDSMACEEVLPYDLLGFGPRDSLDLSRTPTPPSLPCPSTLPLAPENEEAAEAATDLKRDEGEGVQSAGHSCGFSNRSNSALMVESWYRKLLAAGGIGFLVVHREEVVVSMCCPLVASWLGVEGPAKVLGRSLQSLIHADSRTSGKHLLDFLSSGRDEGKVPVELLGANGGSISVTVTGLSDKESASLGPEYLCALVQVCQS